ncbi:Nn.00g025800.m01.CDS01 [Neocucurbitaria sp. VM-36]
MDRGTHNESSPSFHDGPKRRPYQPYCVTEASSRAQSPDVLTPLPLRILPPRTEEYDCGAQNRCPAESTPNIPLSQHAASSIKPHDSVAISPKTESKCRGQNPLPNRVSPSGNTTSANPNHITQAVTPRGSHSIASSDATVCNETPSHPRMQWPVSPDTATAQQVSRKPLPGHSNYVGIDHLPPQHLSLWTNKTRVLGYAEFEPRDEGLDKHELRQPPMQPRTSQEVDEDQFNEQILGRRTDLPTIGISIDNPTGPSGQMVTLGYELPSPNSTVPLRKAYFKVPSRNSQHSDIMDEHAQFPSSVELYTSSDRLLETNDERMAHRRTQPKDANLRYLFGQRPSRCSNMPPLTPSHCRLNQRSDHDDMIGPTLPRSLHSSTDTQGGPRPPPWGSYEALEMQRRQRGDFRERVQARMYRSLLDSSPLLYRGSLSTDSFKKAEMRREVEEYRELVLGLYPDMEFNEEAEASTASSTPSSIASSIASTTAPIDSSMSFSTSTTPTTTTTSSPPASGSSTPVGALAGGVVGGVSAIALLTLLAWYFLRRSKRKKAGENPYLLHQRHEVDATPMLITAASKYHMDESQHVYEVADSPSPTSFARELPAQQKPIELPAR